MRKTAMIRFHEKWEMDPESGCYNWTSSVNGGKFKYPRFWVGGKSVYAHRFYYEQLFGPIPSGLELLHACDNYRCVNPSHLRAGTHIENMADMVSKRRSVASRGNTKITPELAEQVRVYSGIRWTQREIARVVGLSQASVGSILRGESWLDKKPSAGDEVRSIMD